ncbi:MAG TPA: GNAT family N-acetyltransferase [Chthoniobacterales bacterium]|nr:GNAT family N-acetyltransferase [Chthoniobacterales bacterium]HXY60066.1 GNAT family N-acetyltransferase [Chthoniobacterales bacterium]
MKESQISIAATLEAIRRCHPVMKELRPHIHNTEKFVERVQRQQKRGYIVALLESEGEVRAVAGYRFLESLHSGKFLYVDDLVTRAVDRSLGFGGQLFDWLVQQAREQGCENLELDSGVQRFDAHRFYLVKRMNISSYHFRIKIEHER